MTAARAGSQGGDGFSRARRLGAGLLSVGQQMRWNSGGTPPCVAPAV